MAFFIESWCPRLAIQKGPTSAGLFFDKIVAFANYAVGLSIGVMSNPVADQVAFGERALSAVINAMQLIRFDSTKRPHVYAVTLHATIVQLCSGCLALAKTEHTAGIGVMLRSMFEGLVDLDNLVHDQSYYERMDAANLEQYLKLLRDSPTNPLLSGLDKKHDLPRIIGEYQTQLDELRSRKRGQKDLRQRCVDVDRGDEYQSIYLLYCLDAHNNVGALIDRHISGDESETLRVTMAGDEPPLSLARKLHLAVGWMLQSATLIHGAYRTKFDAIGLQHEHEAMRQIQIESAEAPK